MSLFLHFPLYFIMHNDMIFDKKKALQHLHMMIFPSIIGDIDVKDMIHLVLNDSFITHWSIHSLFLSSSYLMFTISIHFHPAFIGCGNFFSLLPLQSLYSASWHGNIILVILCFVKLQVYCVCMCCPNSFHQSPTATSITRQHSSDIENCISSFLSFK